MLGRCGDREVFLGFASARKPGDATMWVILLEALLALAVLAGIVWWTMFAGRRKGERRRDSEP